MEVDSCPLHSPHTLCVRICLLSEVPKVSAARAEWPWLMRIVRDPFNIMTWRHRLPPSPRACLWRGWLGCPLHFSRALGNGPLVSISSSPHLEGSRGYLLPGHHTSRRLRSDESLFLFLIAHRTRNHLNSAAGLSRTLEHSKAYAADMDKKRVQFHRIWIWNSVGCHRFPLISTGLLWLNHRASPFSFSSFWLFCFKMFLQDVVIISTELIKATDEYCKFGA